MKKVVFLFTIFALLFYSCVDPYSPTGEDNPLPPSIISVIPADTTVDVDLNQVITASFSKEISEDSVNEFSFNVKDDEGLLLEGDYSLSEDLKEVSFTPTLAYREGSTYYLTISRAILDTTNIPLDLDNKDTLYQTSFQTVYTPPTILSVSVDGTSPVSVEDLNEIIIKFSEPMLESSINKSTILLTDSEGELTYNKDSMEAKYTLNQNLLPGYEYKLIITKSVKDLSGIELVEDSIILINTID